jgi:hypothetical protein
MCSKSNPIVHILFLLLIVCRAFWEVSPSFNCCVKKTAGTFLVNQILHAFLGGENSLWGKLGQLGAAGTLFCVEVKEG